MSINSILKKYYFLLIILLNLLYMLTGIYGLLISYGVKNFYLNYSIFLDREYAVISNILLTVSLLTIITSIFMYDETLKDKLCLNVLSSVLFIIVIMLEVTVFVSGIMLEHQMEYETNKTLSNAMQHYGAVNQTHITSSWDEIQTRFKCCGIDKYTDWIKNTNSTQMELPLSCCTFPPGSVGMAACNTKSKLLHRMSCLERFGPFIQGYAISLWRAGIETFFIQMLIIVTQSYIKMRYRD